MIEQEYREYLIGKIDEINRKAQAAMQPYVDKLIEMENRSPTKVRLMVPKGFEEDMLMHGKGVMLNGKHIPIEDIYNPFRHDPDCDYHVDQYPWACTCGAIPYER